MDRVFRSPSCRGRRRVPPPPYAVAAVIAILFALEASAATVSLWSPTPFDRGGGPGRDVVVPVSVAPVDGVTSMAFAFTYDPAIAAPTAVYRTPLTHGFSIASDLSSPGVVTLSLQGPPISGSGEVAWIAFRVLAASGATDLTWSTASLNGGAVPAVLQNGRLPVVQAASVGSVPDDARGSPGSRVEVPVTFEPVAGASAVDLRLRFDPNVWTLVTVGTTPLSSGMTLTWNLVAEGEVAISLFQSQPLTGSGPLLILGGDIVGPAGAATALNLTRGDLDEAPALLDDGRVASCSSADLDHDSFSGCAGDCDDANAAVHPGAVEACNGTDDDCDGSVDEGVTATFYRDGDADGYGADGESVQACAPAPGYVPSGGDCDDANAAVHPGASEICNGVDDDCDSAIDEGVPSPVQVTGLRALRLLEGLQLSWTAAAGGEVYDVVRGDLGALRSSGGAWGPSVQSCVVDATAALSVVDPAPLSEGTSWYLARASNCGGAGSWSDGSTSERPGRDAGIAGSAAACP